MKDKKYIVHQSEIKDNYKYIYLYYWKSINEFSWHKSDNENPPLGSFIVARFKQKKFTSQ